ncbi:MAG TPA: hypothetical protein VGP26_31790 [Actinophytocola sp.]|jgi:hypothetical protein|nr:hypothetical protein [Actinophytocola sp.]
MNFRRIVLAAATVLALGGIAPAAAAADPVSVASCGTTAAMWTGAFDGNLYNDSFPGSPPPRLRADVTSSGAGLAVHTVINDGQNTYYPEGTPAIQSGNLVWQAWVYALPFAYHYTYTTNSVTCSGGKVTAFGGDVTYIVKWVGPFANVDPMDDATETFTLTRTT